MIIRFLMSYSSLLALAMYQSLAEEFLKALLSLGFKVHYIIKRVI